MSMDTQGLTTRMLRWRWAAAGSLVLLLTIGAPGSTLRGQAAWPFHLEWNHDGISVVNYQLCVNDACSPLDAIQVGNGWRAPLPMLPIGEYRLVVQACGYQQECLAGTPDLVIRVTPPSGRRPPIDVISGPRIGVGDR